MAPLLIPIVTMLANKGMSLLSKAIESGEDKAVEFIEEKTGIKLSEPGVEKRLNAEDLAKLQIAESEHSIELMKIALANKQEDNRSNEAYMKIQADEYANTRNMQIENLKQDDKFSKRFVYYFAIFWSAFAVIYLTGITFAEIPKENIRFADTIVGFLLGTIVATLIGFFYGNSIKKG
jgi:hypothetical protein